MYVKQMNEDISQFLMHWLSSRLAQSTSEKPKIYSSGILTSVLKSLVNWTLVNKDPYEDA